MEFEVKIKPGTVLTEWTVTLGVPDINNKIKLLRTFSGNADCIEAAFDQARDATVAVFRNQINNQEVR